MKTDSHPAIRRYLVAVDREASALPSDRRTELVEDLREHIEVSLAERPGALHEILAELGDPRDIATTALHEYGPVAPAPGRGGDPRTVLALLSMGTALSVLGHLPDQSWAADLGVGLLLVGVVALCRNNWWSTTRKWQALAALLLPGLVAEGLVAQAGGGDIAVVVDVTLRTVIRTGVLVWLWRCRVEPRGAWRMPVPRWMFVLFWCVLAVCVVLVAVGAFTYIGLSGNIQTAP